MSARQIFATFLALILFVGSSGFAGAADPPPPPPGMPPVPPAATIGTSEATPPRVSYLYGDVAFWRPGAEEWTPATLNTPLAPGDALATSPGAAVEIQIGPRAFVRAAESAQIGLESQEPDVLRLRVTAGHAALDLREAAAGQTIEFDTPNGAFTIERAGYYHVQVAADLSTFAAFRGGGATVTSAGGTLTAVRADQQVLVAGANSARVQVSNAPQLSAWDRWNLERTDSLLQAVSARYVGPNVYGTEALDQYGSWHTLDTYGSVWVPTSVSTGWVPYSTGRWIWDPRFGWTWLDDAPWGWAPYHYGRWVFVGSYWAWAPGPVVVRPAYSPALVVFLGGGVSVGPARPLCWAPLSWGEPVTPWWGRAGFVGVATWRGWGGPRVVNNIVVTRAATVNVTNIHVYRNVHVTDAVVGVPSDRFARGHERPQRIAPTEVRQLTPVRGVLDVRPGRVTPTREPEHRPARPAPAASPRVAPFTRASAPSAATPDAGTPTVVAPSRRSPSVVTPPVVTSERREQARRREDRRDDRRIETERSQTPERQTRTAPQAPTSRPQATPPAPALRQEPVIQTVPPARERREVSPARQAERPAVAAPSPATPSVVTPPVVIPAGGEPAGPREDRRDDRRTETERPQTPARQTPTAPQARASRPQAIPPTPALRRETVIQTVPPARERREASPARQAERPAVVTPPTPTAPAAHVAPAARVEPVTRVAPAIRVAPRQDREQRQEPNRGHSRGDRG